MIKKKWALSCIAVLTATSTYALAQTGQPTVGIGQMNAAIQSGNPYQQRQLADSFGEMIETQVSETQKFRVIERAQIQQILAEKAAGQANITNSGESVTNGGIQGVDYLIYGTITKLGQQTHGTRVGTPSFGRFSGLGNRGFSTSSSDVVMAVDLRITDAHTGEVRYAGTVEEQISSGSAMRVAGIGTGSQAADPLADVQRLTAKAIVAQIATSIYPIKVITQEPDGSYVLNYGNSVLTVGDQLGVFKVGESFKDPDTGKTLGADETRIGMLKVIDTESQFSKAQLVSGSAGAGNVVKRIPSGQTPKAVSRGPALP